MRTYSYSNSAVIVTEDQIIVDTICGILIAENINDAKSRSRDILYENYPNRLGYTGQVSNAFEFNSAMIDRLREEYNKI